MAAAEWTAEQVGARAEVYVSAVMARMDRSRWRLTEPEEAVLRTLLVLAWLEGRGDGIRTERRGD